MIHEYKCKVNKLLLFCHPTVNIECYDNFVFFTLIDYVGNSSFQPCVSIFLSVIVGCVMMRWKMNDR